MHPLLVHDDPLDHLAVRDAATCLLLDLDVLHIDLELAILLLGHHLDGLDSEVREELPLTADALPGHGGPGDLLEHFHVVGSDLDRNGIKDLHGLVRRHAVTAGNDCGVDVLLDEALGLLQQLTGEYDGRGRPVPALIVLGLGYLHDHLGRGVLNVYLLQNGDAIVGDDYVAQRVHEHLVHALRTQGRAYRIRDGTGGGNVVELRLLVLGPLRALSEHDDRLLASQTICHVNTVPRYFSASI